MREVGIYSLITPTKTRFDPHKAARKYQMRNMLALEVLILY